jgi:hypothetical protein
MKIMMKKMTSSKGKKFKGLNMPFWINKQ